MKIWDYAEMAKEARKFGGPEKYADFLVNSGKSEMVPWIIVGSVISLCVGVGGTFGVQKLVKHIKKIKDEKGKKVDIAKQELIQSLKESDIDSEEREVFMVDIDKLLPNESSLKNFSEEELNKLTNLIRKNGLVEPIRVYDRKSFYEIIAGNRRYMAAKRAGLEKVPVTVCKDKRYMDLMHQ